MNGGRRGGPCGARGRGLCGPLPRPQAPPARLRGEEAAALGTGTRREARSAEQEPEPDTTAATATCAAVIKVGRPRATSRAFSVCALCACCASWL